MTPALQPGDKRLAAWAAFAAVAGFIGLQVWAAVLAGVFEYPLDDVYIHLAMAESIARGGYGVSPGEAASASSSILYPLLLVPFAGTEVQRLLPVAWAFVGVAALGWLWGRVVFLSGLRGSGALALALLGPLALNMPGVAFTGMEHTLHAVANLAVVLGLWRFLTQRVVAPWFVAATVLSPLLRLEGLALSLLAALVLIGFGRAKTGGWLMLAVVAPVAAFSGFLVSLGLAPLPGSVLAKMELDVTGLQGIARVVKRVVVNLEQPPGMLLAALVVLAVTVAVVQRRGPVATLAGVLALAGAAHLVAGQIGWMFRYEHYIILAMIAGFLLMTSELGGRGAARLRSVAIVGCALAATVWLPSVALSYVWNPRAMHLQQAQMARFVQDYLRAPVAVNNLGRVAWNNPEPVLDLAGLASPEARALHSAPGGEQPGWAGPLAAAHDIRMAIIYDRWLRVAVGSDWVRLARLTMTNARGALGGWEVAFYATRPADADALRRLLQDFSKTLPQDAQLTQEAVQ